MIYEVAADSDHKQELHDVVQILKAGNLDKPTVHFDVDATHAIKKYLDKEFINVGRRKSEFDILDELKFGISSRKRAITTMDTPQADIFETIKLS